MIFNDTLIILLYILQEIILDAKENGILVKY